MAVVMDEDNPSTGQRIRRLVPNLMRVYRVILLALLTGPVALGGATLRPHQNPASTLVVYATATGRDRLPLRDLTAADLVVKEDGRDCTVLTVEPASAVMQVAILVDDNGTGIFHYGLNGAGELLQGRADLALSVVTNQVQRVFDFTGDASIWFAGFARTGLRPGTPEGGQLLEGIHTAAQDLRRREARRPVILALTVGGDEQSPRPAHQVLDELHRSRAVLHVLMVDGPALRPTRPPGRPSDLLEGNFNLSRVLGDGPKASGGRNREVLAMKAVPTEVQQIARELLSQYAISYVRAGAERPPQKLHISARRPGVNVIAPTRAPAG